MKKLLVFIFILVLFCPISATTESFYEWMDTAFGTDCSYGAVGDKLVIICQYDQLGAESTDLITGTADFHSDDLMPYSAVVLLMMKNGTIYLGAELPLTDGTFMKTTAKPLMSIQFMQDNIAFGN